MEGWLSKIKFPVEVRVDEPTVEPVSLFTVFFFSSLFNPRSRNRVKGQQMLSRIELEGADRSG